MDPAVPNPADGIQNRVPGSINEAARWRVPISGSYRLRHVAVVKRHANQIMIVKKRAVPAGFLRVLKKVKKTRTELLKLANI